MLVEPSVMEQRYQTVLAVIQDGWKVVEVADRLGVSRQAVHAWIAGYQAGGLSALADHSHRPASCPHQIAPQTEALVCELRREHPGWGPRRIAHQLGRQGRGLLVGDVLRLRLLLAGSALRREGRVETRARCALGTASGTLTYSHRDR